MTRSSAAPLYESFDDYDRFVNWDRRLAYELPFIERQLADVDARMNSDELYPPGPRRVLDTACGTGKHAIALAQRGFHVTGIDLSAAMIERARMNAAHAQSIEMPSMSSVGSVQFAVAGFGQLAARLEGEFDAVLCLGNSLPHVLTQQALRATLDDMAAVLRPGGLLFIQNRNMDAVVEQQARWMPLQARQEQASGQQERNEWLFVRFYDFNQDGSLTFNVITLARHGNPLSDGTWVQRANATQLYPWRRDQLVEATIGAGFDDVRCYGDMTGAPYDRESSGNLVLVARRG